VTGEGQRTTPKRLSKETGGPLYLQLYSLLRLRLQRGELSPGDLVPAESELMRTYAVSRITVRKALEQLVTDGFIDRHRGRGSYVKAAAPETRSCLTSFTDQMLNLGRVPTTELLHLTIGQSGSFDDEQLPFRRSEEVALVERLRIVDGRKAALVRSYIPYRLVPGIRPDMFETNGRGQSLLHVLERRFGILLDKGEETIEPVCVRGPQSTLLEVTEGAAVVSKVCLVRDLTGEPVLFEKALWSAPQTQLVQRLPNAG
jgi:DNA-binding GntR family transcriptional regulator